MAVPITRKRNLAFVGHGGSGKTTLCEAMLFSAGVTNRLGTVEDGNTISDTHPEEIRRRYSIYSAILPFDYKDLRLTLIDCPGYLDFIGETLAALSAVDSAVLVVNGVAGVEPQTRVNWKYCEQLGLPRLVFISGLDKENSSWDNTVKALRNAFGKSIAPVALPIGQQTQLKGMVNVLKRRAYIREGDKIVEGEVPAELQSAVEAQRAALVESIVELDESLMERYLVDEPISDEELLAALQAGTQRGEICPVIGGASKLQIGVGMLYDMIETALPHPGLRKQVSGKKPSGAEETRPLADDAPLCARVFKISTEGQLGDLYWMRVYSGMLRSGDTPYNPAASESEKITNLLVFRGKTREDIPQASAGDIVATVKIKATKLGDTLCAKEHQIILPAVELPSAVAYEAIEVDDKNDLEKVMSGLNQYSAMDATLRIHQNEETKEQVVYGMGQLHLDIAAAYVKARSSVIIHWKRPRVPYRETITMTGEAQGKYKKQTGGRGKYGDVHLRLEPQERGVGFEFVDAIVGGVVPNRFLPAIEKGVIETMENGPLSGSRVIDIKVTAFDGSHHSVDSDELSFKVAGSMGFKLAFEKAHPILLEPIYNVTIITPDHYLGEVMADVNTRRGRVGGIDQLGDMRQISAQIPLGELYQYINTLRSNTQGQGFYEMTFSHYEQVPANVQSEIVKKYAATRTSTED
jgi:elongation factor G